MFWAKDFIETAEGLCFAVVEHGVERGRVLCFLRYAQTEDGWQKQSTDQANALLRQQYPEYLYYSKAKAAHLHAVPLNQILCHHQPPQRLLEVLQKASHDPVEQDLEQLCRLYQHQGLDLESMGVTGSLLIGAQNPQSDIDCVVYDRDVFHQARALTRDLIEQGFLQTLNEADWVASYERRSCHLSLDDYVWHEQRKYNKAMINGRKFDLSFVERVPAASESYQKHGHIVLQCEVLDAYRGFDYPALFKIRHPEIEAVVSYTATYTGQALAGEMIEISGCLEQSETGLKRIVIGSSREAGGEYIRAVR